MMQNNILLASWLRAQSLRSAAVVAIASGSLILAGCSAAEADHAAAPPPGASASPDQANAEASVAQPSDPAPAVASKVDAQPGQQESWYAMYVEGNKVGYGRTAVTPVATDGRSLSKLEERVFFSVSRNGQKTEEKIVSTGIETATGELLSFSTEIDAGPEPILTQGELHGGQMKFQTMTTGKTTSSAIAWPAGTGGFKATEESLLNQPPQPGETRKLSGLMIGFNEVAQIEMTAADYEPTTLLDHTEDLLRIQWTATLPSGNVLRADWWTNRQGEVMKMQLDALHQVTYRTTREVALAESGPARFDLLLSTTVRVNRPLEHPEATRRIRYRVQLASGDPSRIFANGLTQRVTSLDPHTAEIEVRAVRPSKPANKSPANTQPVPRAISTLAPAAETFSAHPPLDEDRHANNLVQSDDPQIVALAKQAAGDKTDAWEVAQALERFVCDYIQVKSYSQAFSTAVEVAASREGACTQHAVLLAALARARGIPARVVVGLVYTESHPGFAFHMWDEAWIGDRWIPLDATRGAGGIGAAYLKLADSSLNGQAAYSCFLPVTEVIGQAKIEILEVELP